METNMKSLTALLRRGSLLLVPCLLLVQGSAVAGADNLPSAGKASPAANSSGDYLLGPQDSVFIRVTDETDIPQGPYEVDLQGDVVVPELGTMHAAGLTTGQLRADITERLKTILQTPIVTVSVAEYHSQRVSVLGAVATPGVKQIQGRKTLFEVISEAGGLRQDAGDTIAITRQKQWGLIPLPNAKFDANGDFSVAELNVHSVMNARNPEENIAVKPDDVITVPKEQLVYVIGAVNRSGGFPLTERQSMTVLQALALAEGLNRTASSRHARILRATNTGGPRVESEIDVHQIMEGKLSDEALKPDDILFIPNSGPKSASFRALDALIATGSGVAIYHPF
jgi:polysaccharide biosynthesis/export protein